MARRKVKYAYEVHLHWRRTSSGVYTFGCYESTESGLWIQWAKLVRGADGWFWGWYKKQGEKIYGRYRSLKQGQHVIEYAQADSRQG